MDLSNTAIPPPLDDDDEDVHWALSTASALWSRGERSEALKWLRRAAETASDANADERALTLFKAAADVTARMETPQAAPPAAPAYAQPAQVYAPPPAQHAGYAPQAPVYPQAPMQGPMATPQPPAAAAPQSVPQRAPRPASVPAPAPAAAPRPASVPAPPAPRGVPSVRPSTPAGMGAPPAQPFELQRPGAASARPQVDPGKPMTSPPAARVSRPIHAPPVPMGAHEPSSIRQAPVAEAPPAPQAPSDGHHEAPAARAHGPRVRRPPPSEVETLKQQRPQIQSQVPTSRPPADVRPVPPVNVPPAPISGSSALERPFVDRTPSQVRSRPEQPDEDVTAQRNLADFPGMGFDDLDEETNVLGSAAEHAQLFAPEPRVEDEDRTGELDDKGDATVSTRPGKPPVDLGSTQPDTFEPPKERVGTRRTVDIPAPGSERRGPVLLQGVRVAVLAGVRAGELRVVALEPDAMAPPGGVPAVLLALSPENGSAILRMLNEE